MTCLLGGVNQADQQAVPTKRWFLAYNGRTGMFWNGERFEGDGAGAAVPIPEYAMPILRAAWQNVQAIPCLMQNAS